MSACSYHSSMKRTPAGRASDVCLRLVLACVLVTAVSARKLAQSNGGQASGSNAAFQSQLQSIINGNASNAGPVMYKVTEATLYTTELQENISSSNAREDVVLGVMWDSDFKAASLVFAASDNLTQAMMNSGNETTPTPFLDPLYEGTPPGANAVALRAFLSVSDDLKERIDAAAMGELPSRVLCTGHHGGGALAVLCGIWAAVTYPEADVRLITFGAPRVGSQRFNWAAQNLGDLSYIWVMQDDPVPQQPAQLPPLNITRPFASNHTQGTNGSLEDYWSALNATVPTFGVPLTIFHNFSRGYKPDEGTPFAAPPSAGQEEPGRFTSFVGQVQDSFRALISTAGSFISELFNGDDNAPAPGPALAPGLAAGPSASVPGTPQATGGEQTTGSGHEECSVVLCKLDAAVIASCESYYAVANTSTSASVTSPEYDANVNVYWNETDREVTFSFRGSETRADWIQDFKVWTTSSPRSSAYEWYKGSEVHQGFLQQFQSVATEARAPEYNLTAVAERLSGGMAPGRVVCTGHSLGAGLATLCAMWAAEQYPTADVRCITFGGPKVGNVEFAEGFSAVVGRSYRVVNGRDQVPALPPLLSYVHVDYGIWATEGELLLDDRPPLPIGELTWDDHGCIDHYQPAVLLADNVTLPSYADFQSLQTA